MYRLTVQRACTSLRVMNNALLPYTSITSKSIVTNVLPRNNISTTSSLFKESLTPVPKMGDSITEGTLLKFTKNVGENVALDEIVAIIETDKVTVDVRSPDAGVLKAIHAKVQESVKVGAPLFTIDTDGKGTVSSSSSSTNVAPSPPVVPVPPAPVPVPAPSPVASASSSSGSHHVRTPAIHFRHGQRQVIDQQTNLYGNSNHSNSSSSSLRSGAASSSSAASGNYNATLDTSFPSKATRSLLDLPPMYGRPLMSINEMYLIDSGGAYADVAPPVPKKGSKK